MPECDWYFDFLSPFAYLQWKTRARFAGRLTLRPVPIVLGAILGHWEQKGPAEIPPKRYHAYRTLVWRAGQLGVPFRMPPSHPFKSLSALRLAVALGAGEAIVDPLYDAVFGQGRDLADPAVLAEIGRAFGVDDVDAAIADPAVKDRLRANTEGAIARGVFGVPTIFVGDEPFWGEDMTGLVLAYLDDPAMFDTEELRRVRTLPVGVSRIG